MSIDDFWNHIEEARRRSGSTAEVPQHLASIISELPKEEIVSFRFHLGDCFYRANDAILWLAASVLRGGCSDDSFDYFKGWLIAQGKHVFESALRDPDSIADVPTLMADDGLVELEAMGTVAFHAFQKQTGLSDGEAMDCFNELCDLLKPSRPPRVTGTRNSGFLDFTDEEGAEFFPKLAAWHKAEWTRRYGNA